MLLKCRAVTFLVPLLLVLVHLALPESADAIPAFSRLHKTECSTCHTIYPELNEFGQAFLKNSYVYPGKKKEAVKGGAAETKIEGLWLSGLPDVLPISGTGTIDVAYKSDAFDGNKLDLSTRSLRLQAGGAFREAAGFFLTYNLYSQGMQTSTTAAALSPGQNANVPPNSSTPDIDELFAIWRHALGTPINLRVGRMEPKLSLWKKSDRVITAPSFASTSYVVGNSPFALDAPEDALELNAVLAHRLFVAGGVVDRNGQDKKEGYGHLSYKFGGTDLNGEEPEVDLESDSVWDYLAVTVGGFGYFGNNGKFNSFGVAQNGNDFYRAGAEMDLLYKRFHLKGSGVFGRDDNPGFSASPARAEKSNACSFEGEYMFGAPVNLIALFRYEIQEDGTGVSRHYFPGIAYAPLQNTKLSLTYSFRDTPFGIRRITLASLSVSF